MAKDSGPTMDFLARALEREYGQWDRLYEYGGSDPFWPDGDNLDLTRNHIISFKRQMEKLIEAEQDEPTLFGTSFPDIYYRDLPPIVPRDYMARADEIRAHAKTQLALFEQDPNYRYIREHHYEVFPKGETKATRAAGLSPYRSYHIFGFEMAVKQDDLVRMRSLFSVPYEERAVDWAELAKIMKGYLAMDHSRDDNTPVRDDFEDEAYDEDALSDDPQELEETEPLKESPSPTAPRKISLDAQIKSAQERTQPQEKREEARQEQLSFF